MTDFKSKFVSEDKEHFSVQWVGSINHKVRDSLKVVEERLIDEVGDRTVSVDMEAITWVDSYGLGSLIRLNNRLARNGAKLILKEPSDEVMNLLRLTCLDKILNIEKSAQAA